jgi:dihydroorotate dehydrogenase (NAD+) catalytic subunit
MGEHLPFDYMNAAGWAKVMWQVKQLCDVPYTSHVLVGSYTVNEREGNQNGTNFVSLSDNTSGNVLGLPNPGITWLARGPGEQMVKLAHGMGKKIVLSGAWFSPEEDGILAEAAATMGFDAYESNRGCPNAVVGGKFKPVPSYFPELMEKADLEIAKRIGMGFEIWEKLSPYVNPAEREREARRIAKTNHKRVTVINTVSNFRPRGKHGDLLITAQNTGGNCGMAGAGVKWLGIINAEHFMQLLEDNPSIIVNGAGGILTGDDVQDYWLIGCRSIQVGTAIYRADSAKPLADIAIEWANKHAINDLA